MGNAFFVVVACFLILLYEYPCICRLVVDMIDVDEDEDVPKEFEEVLMI